MFYEQVFQEPPPLHLNSDAAATVVSLHLEPGQLCGVVGDVIDAFLQ